MKITAAQTHISIGDLHGHLKALIKLLSGLEKEIGIFQDDKSFELKPNIQITFTGDYVDRGEDSKAIIETIMALKENNPNNITCLMGNHELLALADLQNANDLLTKFNPEDDLLDFYKWTLHGTNGGIPFIQSFGPSDIQALKNYTHAMDREQPMGQWIRSLEPFSIKTAHGKKVLYVHGGIPETLQNPKKLEEYAIEFHKHMETKTGIRQNSEEKYSPQNSLVGKYSPYWDRNFPNISPIEAKEITKKLNVDYIVIGHTPQRNGIPANYGDCIFNMDVGMAPAYGENTPTAFILNEKGPQLFQPGKGLTPLIQKAPQKPKKAEPELEP